MTSSLPGAAVASLIGRVLVAVLFIPSGVAKLMDFGGTTAYIASVGLPPAFGAVGAVGAIIVEVVLAGALLIGWHARASALVMALFTIGAAVLFHNFWASP